jgi:hypothetical protein
VAHEIFQHLPFPFPGGRFPLELGAVVQRTVLDGIEPAREVIHTADGACVVTGFRHVVDDDPTVEQLASIEPGHLAWRRSTESPWQVGPHEFPDE